MKKISTTRAEEFGKIQGQKLTIGLDLGDRSSWYCVLDESGRVVLEQRLGTTPKVMQEVFGVMPRSRIALETGTLKWDYQDQKTAMIWHELSQSAGWID